MQIKAPTLCLVGDEDGSTPVALVKETAALIAGSRFEIIEGAGHLPNVEKPSIVARLVAEHADRPLRRPERPSGRPQEQVAEC